MRILVIGGTRFLGKHAVEVALLREHEVTLFNRGRTNPELFPDAGRLVGDRDGGLDALADQEWDAVIDTSGYLPRLVGDSARFLSSRAESYLFVSSISVYDGAGRETVDESTPVLTIEDGSVEEVTDETYGPLKALCEQQVEEAFPGRAMIVRPGLIVGPDDYTGRFAYWPVRLAGGGDVLAPEPRDAPCQVIDVRDLAMWMVELVEARAAGTLNAVGPFQRHTLADVLEASRRGVGSEARLVWVDGERLAAEGIRPWDGLPLWLGPDAGEHWVDRVDPRPARAAGLRLRPIEETAHDTLEWYRSAPAADRGEFAMSAEREAELLAAAR